MCSGLKGTGSDSLNGVHIGPGSNTASYADNNHPRMVVDNGGIDLSSVDGDTIWNKTSAAQRDRSRPRNRP